MDAWVIWLVVACILGVGEMHQGGFYLAPFALGAVLAAICGLAGLGILPSALVFLGGSALAFAGLRPIAASHRHLPPALRTGAAALIGRKALVLERIANDEDVGRVRIDGEVWTARSLDDGHEIPAGERVEVIDIHGATALVMR